ncbi:MAG: glycosyltransferase [Planctomycetes bacterium]|nr:glycosyltransferase [Planctomycetota bacterium]
MRILFVVHQYLPRHVTGTEQYVRSLALTLRGGGHDVHIIAWEPFTELEVPDAFWFARDESVEGVPVHRLSVHARFAANRELAEYENPLAAEMFAGWLRSRQFDVVHVFHARHLGTAALTVPLDLGLPLVVHLMDFWFLCPNFLLLRRDGALCDGPPDGGFGCLPCIDPALADEVERLHLRPHVAALTAVPPPPGGQTPTPARRAHALVARRERLFSVLARAHAVLSPSRFLRERFEAQGFPRGIIGLLPYGLAADRFGDARCEPRGEARPLRIGYVGSLTRHKGVHVVIAAVRSLPPDAVQLQVWGSLESVPAYASELQQLAGEAPNIAFRGRFRPDELGRVLAGFDVQVVPSLWYENTPFAALEALQFGLPVVASALGGIAEVVRHEQNGLTFPPGDVLALAAILRRLAGADELRLRLGSRGGVPAIADNVAALLELYGRLAAEAR